ncbi:MAG: HIT family protein [Phycisphaerales bacterium JB040]
MNPIQQRLHACRAGDDPNLIARLPAGYAVLFDHQPTPIRGWCMLLPHFDDPAINDGRDPAAGQLNDLTPDARAAFLTSLTALGDALLSATGCEHVNYLILCNQAPALHAHVVPRFAGEAPANRLADPFVAYPVRDDTRLPDGECDDLIARLRAALESNG